MNAREQARFDMVKRVGEFGSSHAQDWVTPQPPNPAVTPGQNQARKLFQDLSAPQTGLIARIQKNATVQETGKATALGGTTSKSVLRDALMLELRGFNRTAAAIAESTGKPELMDKFRMPHGTNAQKLVIAARAIADAAEPMAADFIAYGHEPTFASDLRAHVADFEGAESTQDLGAQDKAGATAGFVPLLHEAATKVKQLDAFLHNFYRSNAQAMGEWKTASHVERQPKKKKAEEPKPEK